MMNSTSLMMLGREFRARVARRLVPLWVVVGLRDQMPNLDPYVGCPGVGFSIHWGGSSNCMWVAVLSSAAVGGAPRSTYFDPAMFMV